MNSVASWLDPRPLLRDRRKSNRFPVHEELQYRVLNHGADKSEGVGQTVDMSSSGILFATQEKIPLRRKMEVSVCWPARLDGTCPLKLIAVGWVVRSEGCLTALRIERHEFRTRGSSLKTSLPS